MNALVSVASVASASAVPAMAIGSVAGPEDAELLRLGLELDELCTIWCERINRDRANSENLREACARAGLPHRTCRDFDNDEDYRAYVDRWHAIYHEVVEPEPVDKHGASLWWNDFIERMDALTDQIAELEAHTLAGLGVKARAFSLRNGNDWIDEGASDVPQAFVDFITMVCRFCGVEPAAAPLGPRS